MVRTRTICKYTVPRSRNSFICTRENTFCILQSCVTEKREWPHTLLLHRPFIIHRCQGSKCQMTYTLACWLFIRLINVASLRDVIPRNERRWNIYVSCTIFFFYRYEFLIYSPESKGNDRSCSKSLCILINLRYKHILIKKKEFSL